MSLVTPSLLPVTSFDALREYIFKFNVVGGSQVTANKLVIRRNSDNAVIYSEKIESFKYEHPYYGFGLTNGVYYNATITTFDARGNESKPSDIVQFWCYARPTISFTNLPIGNLITNASYSFEFLYDQREGEKINSYKFNLYDSSKSLISTSGIKYAVDGYPPYRNSYLFTGFTDATLYYIEVEGITIHGATFSTGLQEVSVKYARPDLFTLIEVSNNCDEGYITIKSNITLVEGKVHPEPAVYINNKEIDLTALNSYVLYNEGYEINDNFLARIWFRKPRVDSEIIIFSNTKNQQITIFYREGYENKNDLVKKSYIEAVVNSIPISESKPTENYYIYSNYINKLSDNEYYVLWLRRVNNIYQLELNKK